MASPLTMTALIIHIPSICPLFHSICCKCPAVHMQPIVCGWHHLGPAYQGWWAPTGSSRQVQMSIMSFATLLPTMTRTLKICLFWPLNLYLRVVFRIMTDSCSYVNVKHEFTSSILSRPIGWMKNLRFIWAPSPSFPSFHFYVLIYPPCFLPTTIWPEEGAWPRNRGIPLVFPGISAFGPVPALGFAHSPDHAVRLPPGSDITSVR